jgi:hypothetical protein
VKDALAFLGVLALSGLVALLACIGLWTVLGWIIAAVTG